MADAHPATTLDGRYQLVKVVGRGGMGEVWAARDVRLGRDVAVKLLSAPMGADAGVRDRFETEARSAARLNHPNVVCVYDSGEHEGVPYLVMELLGGRTLADEMEAGPMEPERVRSIGIDVLAALEASHRAGILHRDIKPANVLLTADGWAKVADFGIAKSTEGLHLTATGTIVGTAAYLAPERVAGQPASPRSDLYASGVVLYEALSGSKPFDADTPLGVLRAVEGGQVTPLEQVRPGLDPALIATVERAMAGDPALRFATAAEMAEALRGRDPADAPTAAFPAASSTQVLSVPAAADTTESEPPSAEPAAGSPTHIGRDRMGLIVGAAIGILLLVVIFVFFRSGGPSTGPTGGASPTTVAPAAAGGSVPAQLDRAIKKLEEAVRP